MPESSPQTNRKMPDYHDPRYEDQGNYDSYSSHPTDVGDNRVRFFVALFDYDPQTMSPNPDAADEELPFQEGQMIKVNSPLLWSSKNFGVINDSFITYRAQPKTYFLG